ncbi:hypothetical protein Calab_0904 [Caldithrix abyssi DSM 13497]|uniref:Uncharacterized protein n=1 Tax=Caldithrix abyssi DSM 13497 TaxID=880073 RepID=H1XUP2_CALAY|nr:hypothetical protein [Caldithrix abyssi]APF16797.1 hypothetical protein Cabys_46 [Caldithrix abyssi DSM 13497]EHO40541.1 hypothetical protein Calab_0904 [Caldithrix abyssi DSM 13497]
MSKNQIIISVVIILFFVFSLFSYSKNREDVIKKFNYAIEKTDLSVFLEFINEFKKLDEDSKLSFELEESNLIKIINFEKKMFKLLPSDTIFYVHIGLREILFDNAEYSEWIDELFSDYFLKNLKKSLSVLENIKNTDDLEKIIVSAVFNEGAENKIIKFIENEGLTKKKYYKIFLKYRTK